MMHIAGAAGHWQRAEPENIRRKISIQDLVYPRDGKRTSCGSSFFPEKTGRKILNYGGQEIPRLWGGADRRNMAKSKETPGDRDLQKI